MKIISTAELKAGLDRKDKFTIVEVQSAGSYQRGHLPGAINIPPVEFEARAQELLPDQGAQIVVYCSSHT